MASSVSGPGSPPVGGARRHDSAVNSRRLELLAATANDLLSVSEPAKFLQRLFDRLDEYCGLETCFSYRVERDHLELMFCTGVPAEVVPTLANLQFGQAVCGNVALRQSRITVEDIQSTADPMTSLVRSVGIQAYCCHPLIASGKLLGTLSFGTSTRRRFTEDEVSLMHAVSGQVALALERFQYIRELSAKNEELTAANARLEQFAQGVSHDLKEPVRTIRTYSELFRRRVGDRLQESDRKLLAFVVDGAGRLDNLIDALLLFIRNETEAATMQRAEVRPIIDEALDNCRTLLKESGARVDVGDLPAAIRADRIQLARVFLNLITNAVKYRREDPPVIRIWGNNSEGRATFAVQDNGQGIDADLTSSVFKPFRRLHGQRTSGAGLGLAISQRIVQRHGGRIWVESEPGVGSTFFFSVPGEEGGSASRAPAGETR